ncbi:hypothetical protein TSUD_141290 [Trifolium subterraneum]|uniref:Reverse transcriptase domain-containing protein n=1 Tax=Trifolium subterraneum TaxID=3900 RepID=A0A2Z6NQN9_TRISU|nr:hypothetical protein TSUD_141290 [Trifolium subterraneum]
MVYNEKAKLDVKFDDVADIDGGKENLPLKVRVLRLWKTAAFLNPCESSSLDMVLVEEKRLRLNSSVIAIDVAAFAIQLNIFIEQNIPSATAFEKFLHRLCYCDCDYAIVIERNHVLFIVEVLRLQSASLIASLFLPVSALFCSSACFRLLFFALFVIIFFAIINFESLNLDEEEELNFVVGEYTEEQYDLNLCLVGRFVHDRPIRFNSMKACLADVWRPVKGMTVKEATQGLYLFKFFHPLDVEEVLKGLGGRENLEVIDRVTRCANKLQRWGKKKRTRFKEEIDECVRRMNELRGNQDEEGSIQYQELSERHATLLIQEEGYWKQRAKMHWFQEGDMNTRFFHMSATVRSKKKKVTKLIADNGTEAHTQEELCDVAKSYFDTLFKPRDGDHYPVLNLIQPRVADDDNLVLTAPITKVEIQQALFQMHPDKSPGPDGFNPAFYQRFWEQCSDDIFSSASTWLERGYFPTGLNDTNICLIPKCDNPTSMKDLHPISLLAFVEGRSILDNALIATEVIHALKRKTKGRRGELALKIDISKAYDKVDWGILRGVMTRMGFTDVWIRWIMMCVSSVNYSVLMNSDRVGPISPGQGLRQAVGRGDLHGVRICRGAPEVSHLLFADDCFLFCRANVAEVNELMRILHTYEIASGQEVNLVKSEVFISRNMSQAAKEDLSRILGVKLVLVKVRNLFSRDVAEKILETPLFSSVCEDKVVWDEERNGCYSVKSGYKLDMRYLIGSDKYHVMGNWNGIWKAQAPHKARHLLWRLCRGCLPTRSRLLERRVECTLNCPVCDEEIEDELHIFFRCAVAQDSWSAAGLSSILHNATTNKLMLWIVFSLFAAMKMPRQIGRHAFDAWNDWYSVHKLQSNNVSGTTEADLVRWEKPALDWVKCNVDVAFVAGSGRTSMGLCFRDNSGHFMAGMTQWQQTVISSVEGEA